MSVMSDLNVEKAYGAPEMNKEYLDSIINGNALDDPMDFEKIKEEDDKEAFLKGYAE